MFRGINTINLDNKGRIAIPAKHRENLERSTTNQLVITIDPEERCLLMYPLANWEEIEEKLVVLPSFESSARRIQRLLIGHATEVILDQQGRILLPQELRDYAELTKKIVLVGQGKKLEIWDLDHWYKKRDLWLEDPINKTAGLAEELRSISL